MHHSHPMHILYCFKNVPKKLFHSILFDISVVTDKPVKSYVKLLGHHID